MTKTFQFGKIDYTHTGRKSYPVEVKICYEERKPGQKVFSASGDVWNTKHTDIMMGGQCLDKLAQYIKDPVFKEIHRLWKLYRLNDMHPECEHQAALGWRQQAVEKIEVHGKVARRGWTWYTDHDLGLLNKPCPVCGYKYGSAWNYFPIPEEDEKAILKLFED